MIEGEGTGRLGPGVDHQCFQTFALHVGLTDVWLKLIWCLKHMFAAV